MARQIPVLFLDIDGTVRHGPDQLGGRFVNTPGDVTVFPEAVEMMHRWKAAGGRIIAVSNQGGIAIGHVTIAQVVAAMLETNRQTGGLFDDMRICPHHPTKASCWCRKPVPGLVLEGLRELCTLHPDERYPVDLALLVGDRPEDEECARRAGIRFLDAAAWRAGQEPADDPRPTTGGPPPEFPSGCCCALVDYADVGEQFRPPPGGCPVHTPWAFPGYSLQGVADGRT